MQNNQEAMQEAMRIAKSPEGQKLIRLLKQSSPDKLQQVLSSAASGDLAGARGTLNTLLSNPEAQAILNRMGGNNG